MEVMLINPPGSLKKAMGALRHLMKPNVPAGLAYIGAVLAGNGVDVEILDAFTLNYGMSEIMKRIKQKKPKIIGLSCLTVNAQVVHNICEQVRRLFPEIKIILGNIHASLFDRAFMERGLADFIVHGEGEYITLEVVKAILGKEDKFSHIRGISFKSDGQIMRTAGRGLVADLDKLPMVPYHLLPVKMYKNWIHWNIKSPSITMLTSRGCPYGCVFCSFLAEKKVRIRNPESVVDELTFLVKKYGVRQVQFTDAAFPLDKEAGASLCQEIIRRGLHKKIVWVSETRVNLIDKELARLIRASGCRRVAFGIESGAAQVLKKIRKNITVEQIRSAVHACNCAGIDVIGFFMLGLPGDTAETIKETIRFATSLKLYMAKFNMTVPYPGTELYNTLYAKDKEVIYDWENFQQYPSGEGSGNIFIPEGLSKEELLAWQRYAFSQFYFRPGVIFNILKNVRLHSLTDYFWSAAYTVQMKLKA